jgi:tetratricopeptide (TPR) repeat protein
MASRLLLYGLGALLLVLAALSAPGIAAGLSRNAANTAAARACGWSESAPVAGSAWVEAAVARCKGDEVAALDAMRAALQAGPGRLNMARAMEPYNVEMARFAAGRYPQTAEAQFWLGDALRKEKRPEEAVAAYEKGLAIAPGEADTWLEVGNLYYARSDLPAAARAYDRACALKDSGYNGCSRAGDVYMEMKDYERAALSYAQSVAQIPYFWQPSEEGLVNALLAAGRSEEAIPHLRLLAEHGSKDAQDKLGRLGGR